MKLVSGKDMLVKARAEGYAVGAFSAHNIETVQAILAASVEERAPVMIQIGQRVIKHAGMKAMVKLIETLGEGVEAEAAIHLDHGNSFEQAVQAIQLQFQSVMYDGSHHPLEKNIEITKRVVEAAHAVGISVEGELGRIAGTEDDLTVSEEEAFLTNVEDAVRFVGETGVDYLAVAVGTAHGFYRGVPKIHFDRLDDIQLACSLPLVLHGGSGVPDHLIREAIPLGIAKINVDTELRHAFTLAAQKVWEKNPKEYHLATVHGESREAVKKKVIEKIRLFGSNGKAKGHSNLTSNKS
ncbi:ketose-bisphosphate aldolase [Ammoniphilus sp. CFH 90114]|uniref:class II fructose-bisphosphate aldolase n=1 Tax=Ammoniphilus sp. CFH 90114 TaxID=2493665 RepID=UPI00100E94FD|nr:ketose-bisphosphate aldolase [Ammoniphilus sp. CFH 90114]RXT03743.1 ketose-bisphosphate aldolase [Ammoniphilus sp. CFH 90114]